MYELAIWVLDKQTNTFKKVTKSFSSSDSMASWYESNNKNIGRENNNKSSQKKKSEGGSR